LDYYSGTELLFFEAVWKQKFIFTGNFNDIKLIHTFMSEKLICIFMFNEYFIKNF